MAFWIYIKSWDYSYFSTIFSYQKPHFSKIPTKSSNTLKFNISKILLFLIHTFHIQKPFNTTQFHNPNASILSTFFKYLHWLPSKVQSKHFDKKSLYRQHIFELVFMVSIHYIFFSLPGKIIKSTSMTMNWARQHSVMGITP